jgi:valyl-tRNA synthetase
LYFAEKEKCKSIHISKWPEYDESLIDEKIEEIGDQLITVISEVRKVKSENNVSLKEPVKELVLDMKEEEVKDFIEDLKAVTKAEKVSYGKKLAIKL